MGGWKKTHWDYVYVVAWDEARLMKIGVSQRQRWRRFELRGARVLALMPVTTKRDVWLEQLYQDAAGRVSELAFAGTNGDGAIPFLGDRAGYLECYRIPEGVTAERMLAFMHRIVLEHRAHASAARFLGHMQRTEKYERTYADVVTPR